MGKIRLVALGAGQDVGRSCVLVTLGGRTVMFDCGMHMGFNDERRFPDFSVLSPTGRDLTQLIDCVIITHFHLDHCGALPYLTEMCGYTGPVIMTHPTKALCPLLLEDYRRITVERKGETNFFTSAMIRTCIDRVTSVDIKERFHVGPGTDFEVRAFYAGHVLGAAMFQVRVGTESVLYTGDYNMTPDRHLGAASADLLLEPDVLITESTYATTLRDSKRARERDFLRNIHQCVAAGGKVLIPVFALGRVQELCILVEAYWERLRLNIPVYFSAGMAETANAYYRTFVEWTNENILDQLPTRNLFDFAHVRPFEKHYADLPGPMVLFSSPGMLHSGTSLEIFKKWCADEKNLLIIPGFCVSGTVGAKVLAGQHKIVMEDTGQVLDVRMQVKNMSFSAHADARGIMQMIKTTRPRNIVLVHGEASKMTILKAQIIAELALPCFDPPNGHLLELESRCIVPVRVQRRLIDESLLDMQQVAESLVEGEDDDLILQVAQARCTDIPIAGCLSWSKEDALHVLPPRFDPVDYAGEDGVRIKTTVPMTGHSLQAIHRSLQRYPSSLSLSPNPSRSLIPYIPVAFDGEQQILQCRSISFTPRDDNILAVEWSSPDTRLAQYCIDVIANL